MKQSKSLLIVLIDKTGKITMTHKWSKLSEKIKNYLQVIPNTQSNSSKPKM